MDKRSLNQTWETEYICERVKRITDAVKRGNYRAALDMLDMIRYKTDATKNLILEEFKKEK